MIVAPPPRIAERQRQAGVRAALAAAALPPPMPHRLRAQARQAAAFAAGHEDVWHRRAEARHDGGDQEAGAETSALASAADSVRPLQTTAVWVPSTVRQDIGRLSLLHTWRRRRLVVAARARAFLE